MSGTDALSRVAARLRAAWEEALGNIQLEAATAAAFAHARPPCAVLAVGKSAGRMMDGVAALHPNAPRLCILPEGARAPQQPVDVFTVAHPRPDERVFEAAQRVMSLAALSSATTPLWLLLSGGTSACVGAPLQPSQLEELGRVLHALMQAGAPIEALNTVRKHACQVLGGRLGAACHGLHAAVAVDIASQDWTLVGSGPAVADRSRLEDARRVLREHGLSSSPLALMPSPACPAWQHTVVASPGMLRDALQRALGEAAHLPAEILTTPAQVDALVLDHALQKDGVVAAVGEVPFPVPAHAPPGGRAAHLALHLAVALHRAGRTFVVHCAGSDGRDGPTQHAGACVTSAMLEGQPLEVAQDALQQGRSHALLERWNALLPRRETGLNLLDGCVVWACDGALPGAWG